LVNAARTARSVDQIERFAMCNLPLSAEMARKCHDPDAVEWMAVFIAVPIGNKPSQQLFDFWKTSP
jgi:hypothetical protein